MNLFFLRNTITIRFVFSHCRGTTNKKTKKVETRRPPAVIWCLRRCTCIMDSPALRHGTDNRTDNGTRWKLNASAASWWIVRGNMMVVKQTMLVDGEDGGRLHGTAYRMQFIRDAVFSVLSVVVSKLTFLDYQIRFLVFYWYSVMPRWSGCVWVTKHRWWWW